MKILKKLQLKTLGLCITLLALTVSLFTGVNFVQASAETQPEVTYIDTDVEGIVFAQHPTCVFFGFKLTESDYDDFGNFEGDYANTAAYVKYEEYIALQLTYWKNFSQMNSEGVILDQLYAYWDAGRNPNTGSHALMHSVFANTLAHRSTLALLEYGFVISIPAGTTFPSATYVHGGCEGTPIMYRTTQDIAFYYNGSTFQVFQFSVSQERTLATEEVNSVDLSQYYAAERNQVTALINDASAALKQSFTSFAIQDVLATFYKNLDGVMTIADYAELANKKTEAKAELSAFFAGLSQADYEDEDWNSILVMQNEISAVVDSCGSMEEVNAAVFSIQYSVDKVLTKTEKAGFADYKAAAVASVEKSFVETLYREQERAQGAAFVQTAKDLIGQATSYDEVDGLELTYITRIGALKTKAEWEEEERVEEIVPPSDSTEEENSTAEKEDANNGGCGSALGALGIIFGVVVVAALSVVIILNKKRKDLKNEK